MVKYSNSWIIDKYQRAEELEYLFFWGHQADKDGSISKTCLSQWWMSPFEVNGIVYKTAEHWMMANKARLFHDEEKFKQIITASSPAAAKKLGRSVKGFDPVVWDENKFNLVVAGNLYKFSGDAALKKFLLSTGDRIIVEASPLDTVWGIGIAVDHPSIENPTTWRGENLLGYALMEVRDKLL